jgi:hypothetical protein
VVAALRWPIGSQRRFRDVCAKSKKWFHARENCFVAARATKHFAWKSQQFEAVKSQVVIRSCDESPEGTKLSADDGCGLPAVQANFSGSSNWRTGYPV